MRLDGSELDKIVGRSVASIAAMTTTGKRSFPGDPFDRCVNGSPQRPGTPGALRHFAHREDEIMKTSYNAITAPPRAVRLHIEAGNCLAIAIGKKDPVLAAELIDEAIRLERRARELAANANDRPAPGKFR